MVESIELIPFRADHIPLGMQLKNWARWNQVAEDWELLLRMSLGGSFVAMYQGKPAGTTLTIAYANSFSWIGMVLVDPAYRGRGIGTHLLRNALTFAQSQGPVLLDATALGQPLYHSLGFEAIGEVARLQLAAPRSIVSSRVGDIRSVQVEDLPKLLAYDQRKVQFKRAVLLEDFLRRGPAYAFVAYQDQQLVGYTLGRTGSHFHHIGPLVAEKQEVGQALLKQAMAAAPPQALIIDVPMIQEGWYAWLIQQGFFLQRPLTRMCLGSAEKALYSLNQYAIAGPALG